MKSKKPKTNHIPEVSAILVAVQTPADTEADVRRSMRELALLVEDLNAKVVHQVIQKRSRRKDPSYIGEGKLQELASMTGGTGKVAKGPEKPEESDANFVVVVDDEITPTQQRNLHSALGVTVIDRVSVILKIFEKRARTKEAKLQIELAALEYQLPRIREDHSLGDREGGGGRASRGHTNVELSKQRMRQKISSLQREIANLSPVKRRNEEDFRVAFVGYTNAGKSSLSSALTKADIYVEDKLFATLGTTTKKMIPPSVPPIYLTDTVGFIERLPHGLIASFRSTLAEARDAWLLVRVLDASDEDWRTHLEVTTQVLDEMEMGGKDSWLVFNKIDRVSSKKRAELVAEFPQALFVSALNADDMKLLRQAFIDHQRKSLVESDIVISVEAYPLFASFREHVQIISEKHGEDGTTFAKVLGTDAMIQRLKAKLG